MLGNNPSNLALVVFCFSEMLKWRTWGMEVSADMLPVSKHLHPPKHAIGDEDGKKRGDKAWNRLAAMNETAVGTGPSSHLSRHGETAVGPLWGQTLQARPLWGDRCGDRPLWGQTLQARPLWGPLWGQTLQATFRGMDRCGDRPFKPPFEAWSVRRATRKGILSRTCRPCGASISRGTSRPGVRPSRARSRCRR